MPALSPKRLTTPKGRARPEYRLGAPGRAAAVETAVLLCAGALGIAARFVPATPLWLDEALSVNIADRPLGQIDDVLRHDGHPPLYYYVLSLWMRLFGTGDMAVRSLSILFGLLTIALVVAVCRRHGGRELSTLAAFAVAVSPYAVRYASETRMYSMVMTLALCGWFALIGAVARPSLLRLVPVSLIAGALLLTHYWAFFLVGAVLLLLVVHAWFVPAERRSHLRVAGAVASGGLFFVPWLPAFFYQLRHTGTPWASRSRPTRVLSESLVDFAGGLDPEAVLLLVVLAILVVVGVFGRRNERLTLGRTAEPWVANAAAVAAGTAGLGALVSFVTNSAFAGRYAAVYFPIFVILVAVGLTMLDKGWVRTAAVVTLAVLSLVTVAVAVRRDRTQAGAIAAIINEQAAAGDLVVACPDQLGPSLRRAVRSELEVLSYPDLSDPRLVDWVDYEERYGNADPVRVADAIVARTAGGQTIWLVFSSAYRVVLEQCDRLVDALAQRRPRTESLATPDGVRYFESAALRRFDP